MNRPLYCDLHVHLAGIKMAAARDLTVAGVLDECVRRKGIGMVGIIDAAAVPARAVLRDLVREGDLFPLPGGGLSFRDRVTLIPGAEVEVYHEGPIHLLCYFPDLAALEEFGRWQESVVRNPSLSTQRHRATGEEVVRRVAATGGFVVPAHAFTPYKSILAAAGSVEAVIPRELWAHVPGVELGLSSDTALADRVPELQHFTFVTGSDAHSRGKIAREYMALGVEAPSFAELKLALEGADGRQVLANFGLDPRLGKYHRSFCLDCDGPLTGPPPQDRCPRDPAHRLVLGVLDRIYLLAGPPAGEESGQSVGWPLPGRPSGRPRPPYVHQVPLQFVPGLGPRALDRLLAAFGSEMAVLHEATREQLAEVVGPALAGRIDDARSGRLGIAPGAGGAYGKLTYQL
ncbi:endonuclease Q family protein [Caldinitratiruptor microaerophilus]|uniref:TIGR00375 family protein n=1 Tax=Caldinitratiruptor microaerophilus TaxID=671077 RepID=A0AA35CK33_9FIRM|nr:endonuclease Q family protein [Caldinitratiruptor microaerophilus]BDG59949.1 hypothetical protein caldi_10390 [Caldinitratiruptor microaerophilus]